MEKEVVVIGGGASGTVCAIHLARAGFAVTIIDKNPHYGMKLRITGKGRCNVTNHCTNEVFLANIPRNARFLYSAINAFSTADTESFFEGLGVPLKVERGNRVFPQSDKAMDIVMALERECNHLGVKRIQDTVLKVTQEGQVLCKQHKYTPNYVVLATGGATYPTTGSTGDGYKMAEGLGHTIQPISPSLVPLTGDVTLCSSMQGLSLKNVALTIYQGEKKIYTDFGEMMFTHFGMTGPMILSASAYLTDIKKGYRASIDLKPALTREMLEKRLIGDFTGCNKDLGNLMTAYLPQTMIVPFLKKAGVPPNQKANSIKKEQREALINTFKDFSVNIDGTRPLAEGIITRGGISIKEVNPKTMESKLVENLYIIGEVLDMDAYTGGFNLQIAFSTAFCAAKAIIEKGAEL